MPGAGKQPLPRYQQIKDDLLSRIAAGEWQVGEAIPPEETLARQFAVARMTVNRALRELTQAGHLRRLRGSGTFVAPPRVESSLLEIRNIAEEIAERGHQHDCEVHRLERAAADTALAKAFRVARGSTLFRSVIVHRENGELIQVEDRWVNSLLAPEYLAQEFTQQTPSAYLSSVAPLTNAHFTIEARLPTRAIARMLGIDAATPCLVVHRSTQSGKHVASIVTLWHPGARYRLTGGL